MKKIFLFTVAALMCSLGMAQNSTDLKLNLEKNRIYRFNSLSEQTITQTVSGMAQNIESKTSYAVSLKMMDATPDFMITEVRFDTVDIRTNAMGKATNISSVNEGDVKSKETADLMSYFMNRFCKNALFVKMDFTGKVLEIVNAKMLSDIVLKDTASITLTGMMGDAIKKEIVNLFSANTLKTMIEMFTWNLPGKQVSTGEKWDITQKLNSGGMTLDIITSYQLDKLDEKAAHITAESAIKAADNAEPINSGGATVTYDDLQGLSKSTLVIDIRTGLPIENSGKTQISGNLGVSAPGLSMQIPMDINGETKVKALQ